ncbi:hypothetical protein ACIQAC_23070 [Streptomyces sp. NPDC088387]|uniref:hypothetical protein n=1 Tax=Streptomyces sp. NPDC088387 TaxID=3365859 RepID=UPI00381C07A7
MGDLSMLFTMAVEFAVELTAEQVSGALAAVQRRHPLLQAQIEDHPVSRLGFYRPEPVPPIGLVVLRRPAETWQRVAGEEVVKGFDTSVAPLMRAVLIGDGGPSVLLLTLYHSVADGVGTMALVRDMVRALNGEELAPLPFPPAQEDLIGSLLPAPTELEAGPPPADDPRMDIPVAGRPYDGAVPAIATLTLDEVFTRRLAGRSRQEKTTVHSVVSVAAARARSVVGGEEYVRVLTPFDLRPWIGGDGVCVDYHAATRTGSEPFCGDTLWDQARAVRDALAGPRSPAAISAASAAIQKYVPVHADAATATAVMGSFAYDILVSNKGVVSLKGALRPVALWGGIAPSQLEGEDRISVITYDGQLRLTANGYGSSGRLLAEIRDVLHEAVAETP